jgi:hypothetical protein
MGRIRYANIGVVVTMAFIVPSALLFKDAGQAAAQVIVLVGFVLGMVVMAVLEERDWRRRKRDQ